MEFLTQAIWFYFYRRYKWRAQDFTMFQNTIMGYLQSIAAGFSGGSVLQGLLYDGGSDLSINVSPGLAFDSSGNILALNDEGTLDLQPSIKSLIVIRKLQQDENAITNPTDPLSTLPLNITQGAQLVAIAGDADNYPSKADGDVILFGVETDDISIRDVDSSMCEFITKMQQGLNAANPYTRIIGNQQYCHFRTIQDLVASGINFGDRIRVIEDQTLIDPLLITQSGFLLEFDPEVQVINGGAATGIDLQGDRVSLIGGRFTDFTDIGDVAVHISGNYQYLSRNRFGAGTTNPIIDDTDTSNTGGILVEV